MPDKYDLALYRGDSFTWTFILWTDPTKTARFDLTGVTLKAEIRDKPAGLTIVELTCAAVGAPEDGTVQVDLSAEVLVGLACKDLHASFIGVQHEHMVNTRRMDASLEVGRLY